MVTAEKKQIDVTLPVEIIELLNTWAARADLSRDALVGEHFNALAHVLRVCLTKTKQPYNFIRLDSPSNQIEQPLICVGYSRGRFPVEYHYAFDKYY